MPYPVIIAVNGDPLACVNPDGNWSVRWDRVTAIAYDPPHARAKALWAYCKLLVAARDNFILTPWDESKRLWAEWQHYEAIFDYVERDPIPGQMQSTITYNDLLIACVNYDGSWSVDWDEVLEIARWTKINPRAVALVAICRLLKAGKDRFVVTPWADPEEDE